MNRDVEFRSEFLTPGDEAWIVIGVPEGMLPVKENPRIEPLIGASFDVLALGDLPSDEALAHTKNTCSRAGWIKVRNVSRVRAQFVCVFRFVPDTSKMERELGHIVETAWREGTRNGSSSA
jgi:hypothetical protein